MSVFLSLVLCGVVCSSDQDVCKPRQCFSTISSATKQRRLMVQNACSAGEINHFVRHFCQRQCTLSGVCVHGCGVWCRQYLPKGWMRNLTLCEKPMAPDDVKSAPVVRTKALTHVFQSASLQCALGHAGLRWTV